MNSTEKAILSMARRAIQNSKLAVAAAYLNGLPECYEVIKCREYLNSVRLAKQEYSAMSDDEREAYNNH